MMLVYFRVTGEAGGVWGSHGCGGCGGQRMLCSHCSQGSVTWLYLGLALLLCRAGAMDPPGVFPAGALCKHPSLAGERLGQLDGLAKGAFKINFLLPGSIFIITQHRNTPAL